ncbi:MAG: hypothetical protein K8S97_06460, partial [Anaerolineae bacterium]|nr:hypothetical protein [Anaerolineae bacterium]
MVNRRVALVMDDQEKTMVHEAPPRTTVQVIFPDGVVLEGPVDTTLEVFVQSYERTHNPHGALAMAALVDGRLRELTRPVTRDVQVQPVRLNSSDGGRIYRRSLAFLLTVAAAELFPGVQIVVDHSLPSGAYFCRVREGAPFTVEQ